MAGSDMSATKIPDGRHALRLGDSFFTKSGPTYHTMRYDFKPASVGDCKETYVEVAENQEVTVTVPKLDETGEVRDATMFKGPRKQYQKECLLIYNHETGEFVLEQLAYNIQLKKTRGEVTEDVLQHIRETRRNVSQNANSDHSSMNGATTSASAAASIGHVAARNGTPMTTIPEKNHMETMSESDGSAGSESDSSEAGSDDEMQSEAGAGADDADQFSEDELAKTLEAELSSSAHNSKTDITFNESSTSQSRVHQSTNFQSLQGPNVSQPTSSNLQQDLLLSESSDEDSDDD